jgi:DNA-binding LytR/AlgR family response regulator
MEEKLCSGHDFFRCHRTYIVNTSKIADVSGNAQGLKLEIEKTEFKIPVSRSQIPEFKKLMEKAKN